MKRLRFIIRVMFLPLTVFLSMAYIGIGHAGPSGGDPVAGDDVYASECSDCHSVHKGKNKKGPSLFGVIGRHSGSIPNFKYSDAMKSYNVVWTPEKIDKYITNPKAVVPGGKMKYKGLHDAKQRADLLAFLATKK